MIGNGNLPHLKGDKMTEQTDNSNVPEFPLTLEEIAKLEAEAQARVGGVSVEGATPSVPAEPSKKKFYSYGIMTQVNKKINLRVFYDLAKAEKFYKQARSIGVMTTPYFTRNVEEENDMIATFRGLQEHNPKKAGSIQIETNPADHIDKQDKTIPAPAAAFGKGAVVEGAGIPEGTTVGEEITP
jgi:hypothetical protein